MGVLWGLGMVVEGPSWFLKYLTKKKLFFRNFFDRFLFRNAYFFTPEKLYSKISKNLKTHHSQQTPSSRPEKDTSYPSNPTAKSAY